MLRADAIPADMTSLRQEKRPSFPRKRESIFSMPHGAAQGSYRRRYWTGTLLYLHPADDLP